MSGQWINIKKSTRNASIVGGLIGALILSTVVGVTAWGAAANSVQKTSLSSGSSAAVVYHLHLTIATGLGPTGDWPAFVPSKLTLPQNATVVVTIADLDNATALPASLAKVSGTVGNTVQVSRINPSNPNKIGSSITTSRLDPTTEVGHTFTIPQLGINVPVAADAIETFTIHTGASDSCGANGECMWRCDDPCGSGSSGWGGPMAAAGFMSGAVTLV